MWPIRIPSVGCFVSNSAHPATLYTIIKAPHVCSCSNCPRKQISQKRVNEGKRSAQKGQTTLPTSPHCTPWFGGTPHPCLLPRLQAAMPVPTRHIEVWYGALGLHPMGSCSTWGRSSTSFTEGSRRMRALAPACWGVWHAVALQPERWISFADNNTYILKECFGGVTVFYQGLYKC